MSALARKPLRVSASVFLLEQQILQRRTEHRVMRNPLLEVGGSEGVNFIGL